MQDAKQSPAPETATKKYIGNLVEAKSATELKNKLKSKRLTRQHLIQNVIRLCVESDEFLYALYFTPEIFIPNKSKNQNDIPTKQAD